MIRLFGLNFFALCLLSCAPQSGVADTGRVVAESTGEKAERDRIITQVQSAIAANDFGSLASLEEDYRASRARTPSGIWKLAVFHATVQWALADGLQAETGCQLRKSAFVDRWLAAAPDSPGPVITQAALLMRQAWCIRGTGFANTVPAETWPQFHANVSSALRSLDANSSMASTDPEFYAIKLSALRGSGAGKAEFERVLNEAVAREPYYHRTYFNAAWSYLPQWGGSDAELEAFARYAAERTRASDRSGYYARIFWSLDECGCKITERVADWPTLKQSMRDVYDRFPVRANGEYFADLSCRVGQGEEGRRYLRLINPEVKDDRDLGPAFANCDYQVRNAEAH